MAQITFPFTGYLNNGYAEELQTSFVETTPDAGSQFRRETFTDIGRSVRGSKIVDDTEKGSFVNFYQNDTRSGSKPFMFYDCSNNINRQVKFIGKPSISRLSDKWSISFSLWFEPTKIVAELSLITEDGKLLITEDDKSIVADVEFNV